jgi:hypothetical protein
MKKYRTGFIAVMLGIALAFGTSAFKNSKKNHSRDKAALTEFYFQFMGTHGNESNTSLWKELSSSDYDLLDCPGSTAGCKIISSSVTGTVPDRHPTSVPVDANSKPTITSPTLEAEYKNQM